MLLALVWLPVARAAADLRPLISREARTCGAAWERGDAATIVTYLPAPIIQQSGGREAVRRDLQEQFAQARALGAERLEIAAGKPSVPKTIGRWLVSVLPVVAIVHSAHLDLTQETQVLALSSDRGRRWSFVLLYAVDQPELTAWFPEFRGRVVVPKPAPPQLRLTE